MVPWQVHRDLIIVDSEMDNSESTFLLIKSVINRASS